MPIHDWTKVTAGDFHDFHTCWIVAIRAALNGGLLPPDYIAMAEQTTGDIVPDVVTLQTRPRSQPGLSGGTALKAKPAASIMQKLERAEYSRRKNRVVIRHRRGRVVAIIELISPGNKDNQHAFRTFLEKSAEILQQNVNLLIVDLFPPTPRDPDGIHNAIWSHIGGELLVDFQTEKPLTVASYHAGAVPEAFVEPLSLGEALPAMPIFLSDDELDYVNCPLEETYQQAWATYPQMLKELLEA